MFMKIDNKYFPVDIVRVEREQAGCSSKTLRAFCCWFENRQKMGVDHPTLQMASLRFRTKWSVDFPWQMTNVKKEWEMCKCQTNGANHPPFKHIKGHFGIALCFWDQLRFFGDKILKVVRVSHHTLSCGHTHLGNKKQTTIKYKWIKKT